MGIMNKLVTVTVSENNRKHFLDLGYFISADQTVIKMLCVGAARE